MLIRNFFTGLFVLTVMVCSGATVPFDLVTAQKKVSIYYDSQEGKLDSIAANLLAADIERVTGFLPKVSSDIRSAKGNIIVIGSIRSGIAKTFLSAAVSKSLNGKWECYNYTVISAPSKNINSALLITGSDLRGTAYGVFNLSEKIGVSPYYWWADVTPVHKSSLSVNIESVTSSAPSVKYRGIFINDEDWGLQPWAAKTFEPETGDIGPKTYAKVFELLLRLKANLVWPAMHPSTKAFFHYPANLKVAEDYQIVIGSSHAEPMLRNNVDEWDVKSVGNFNYLTNKQKVDDYWETRIKESKNINAIYSMGMRGVHDGAIEGVKTPQQTVPLLEQIFGVQRNMLKKNVNPDISKVPQAFTAYKEVLEVYDAGLKVPEDITLVWPDDNYGYIQRLSDEQESKRAGGAGVYYHASYWGRPHDYLWISTTSPGLMREEMTKAYAANARKIWVLNVGDIKPAEYNIKLFLDMAYQIEPFNNSKYLGVHLFNWVKQNIDSAKATVITPMLNKCYQLAFERRPEFMGWSQTEPTTKVKFTAYNHEYYGDQAQKRIDAYDKLETLAKTLQKSIPANRQPAFYQLVYYPVTGASLMNKKFLYRDKAYLYAKQGRSSAAYYDSLSRAAYREIIKQTAYFNKELQNGKWNNMMSMQPRNLPVFSEPELNYKIVPRSNGWITVTEGNSDTLFAADSKLALPAFNSTGKAHFIDLALTEKGKDVTLKISTKTSWVVLPVNMVKLTGNGAASQYRLWVKANTAGISRPQTGVITISDGTNSTDVAVTAQPARGKGLDKVYVENNGYVSIYAKNYHSIQVSAPNHWELIEGLGSTGTAVEALPIKAKEPLLANLNDAVIERHPWVSYNFFALTGGDAAVKVFTLPTFAVNHNFDVRYAVSVDGKKPEVISFKTVGRSEEWKQNVLSNQAVRTVKIANLAKGNHTLRIYMIDQGVILDKIIIDLGGLKPFYGTLEETLLLKK